VVVISRFLPEGVYISSARFAEEEAEEAEEESAAIVLSREAWTVGDEISVPDAEMGCSKLADKNAEMAIEHFVEKIVGPGLYV